MKNWPLILLMAIFFAGMIYLGRIAQPPSF